MLGQRIARPHSAEELAHAGPFHAGQLLHGANSLHPPLGEYRHAVGRVPEQVQVVRNHHHRQALLLAQLQYQFVHAVGAFRVQPGGGFVQKQQFRVQGQRTRQRGAFEHSAAQAAGVLPGYFGLQAALGHFFQRHGVHLGTGQTAVFAQRQADVFQHGQGGKQAPMLKHHAPALAQSLHLLSTGLRQFRASTFKLPASGCCR